jgi:hypothetical protein
MRETFKGYLMLRLFAFIPLLIAILVLLGVSALARGSDALGIAILVAVPVAVAALAWLIGARRRASWSSNSRSSWMPRRTTRSCVATTSASGHQPRG